LSSAATATRGGGSDSESQVLFSSPEKRGVILSLLLIVATLALYNPVGRHPFVNYDDDRYISNNGQVRAGLTWHTLTWAFTTTSQANWHPLTWISHALDCQFFRLNPAGHHYTNLLLHAANAVLLFLWLQWTTGFTWRSLTVAALFAVHPTNVESVAWVAERKNVLSMLFFLLTLWAYSWYARRPGVVRYGTLALSYALGLMCKPQVITLPFVLLLWDFWPLRRMFPVVPNGAAQEPVPGRPAATPFSWLLLEKVPLLLLSLGSAIITIKAQSAGGALRSIQEYSFGVRAENALVAYLLYLGKAFWPLHLAPMYPHPGNSLPGWQALVAALVLLAITIIAIVTRQHRYVVVGWFWFLGTLVPMIGLVQVGAAAMADRYAYLPFLGLFIAVCWGVSDWALKYDRSDRWLAATSAIVLLALSAITYRQLGYWRDNVTLWSHTIAVTPNYNFVAQDNLGGALVSLGRIDEAMPHFRAAVAINPLDPVGNLNLATNLQQHGKLREAIAGYQIVLRMSTDPPLRATAYSNLGSAYRAVADFADARRSYEAALLLVPDTPKAFIGLGLMAQKAGDLKQAAQQYARAMATQPTDVGYILLGKVLEQAGHPAEAEAAFQAGQRISRDWNAAQNSVAQLLAQ
jgi:tetratricopeptide (TPR) repeat protein